jgi:hypothetical protein
VTCTDVPIVMTVWKSFVPGTSCHATSSSMKDTSLADPSKDSAATGMTEPSFAEPTEEMKKRREPPTHFTVQYIDDCLIITACYASHIRALKRFLMGELRRPWPEPRRA